MILHLQVHREAQFQHLEVPLLQFYSIRVQRVQEPQQYQLRMTIVMRILTPLIIQGEGIDANAGSPLLITQYYEGTGSNQWIEVKNVSTSNVTAGSFFLALYTNLRTTINIISTQAPEESIAIPAFSTW